MKVIFHILDQTKWQTNLDNIRDLLSYDSNAQIEVIVGAEAAQIFTAYSGLDFGDLLDSPKVHFSISKMAMDNYKMEPDLLPNGIVIEDLLIAKTVRLQNEEGYAYIRL
ncbi:hypothetical protein O6R05_02980 [Peptoniphilus equinus]|uniref:DsrE/DsrF-like family protein n=1 Tax=Peptoniphilus equinus TaxID=3016343 RepID=A0ABY7QUR6_9FIRM|nr:hypothetical protein [Peptoniphilus equinus]WBW50525.1 hypothetical protein O6R05_02980 [Peptoniphilus equinus]